MKCHKCGYVSFDYLSECKKCGVDLSGTRDKLGLPPMKPSEPFFLGALLKDNLSDARKQFVAPSGGENMETELAEIELGQDASFDLDFDALGDSDASQEAFPGQAHVRGQLDSARKVMEDIETERFTGRPASSAGGTELDLDAILDAADAVTVEERGRGGPAVGQTIPENTEFALSMEDLEELSGDLRSSKEAGDYATSRSAQSRTRDESDLELLLEDEPPHKTDDEMVIELSSEDLEGLLLELDETPGGSDKKGKDKP